VGVGGLCLNKLAIKLKLRNSICQAYAPTTEYCMYGHFLPANHQGLYLVLVAWKHSSLFGSHSRLSKSGTRFDKIC